MTNKIIIRNAEYGDMDAMVSLLSDLFALEADFQSDPNCQLQGLTMFMDGCKKHKCIQVAEVDGNVVGMCTAQMLISNAQGTPAALVEDLVVDANYRRRGIGRQLMLAIELWARAHGATRLNLLAALTNTKALDFYKKLGWNRTQLICLKRL